jgi:hypothetical protein
MPPINELVLVPIVLLLILLYLRELILRHQLIKSQTQEIAKAQLSAQQIVDSAVKKSQELISQAELSSIKVVADSKEGLTKGQSLYDSQLKMILQQFEASIANELRATHERISRSEQAQENFLLQLQDKLGSFQRAAQDTLNKNTTGASEEFKERLSDSLRQIQDDTTTAVEKDLQTEHDNVQRFQQQQITAVQNNLVSILERTLELVLARRLSLADHTDLINEAFEEAKREKFLS